MSTESGFPYLDQPEAAGPEEETIEADETAPAAAKEPVRTPRPVPTASPLTPEDEEALRKIAESLGGNTGGKLSLRLRRFRRGEGLKSIRAIALERWMFEDGFDLEKVIGEHYGDGKYHWEIRNSGKYFKCGVCDIETYGTFTGDDDEGIAAPPPVQEPAPVDFSGLTSQIRNELLAELRPKETVQAPAVDIAGMVRSALEPVIRVLESKATEKQSDPSVAAVLGLLSQQNQTLMTLIGKALETPRVNPAPAAASDPIDSFGKLLDIARQLQPSFIPMPANAGGSDDGGGDDDDDYELPPADPEPPKSLGQRIADTFAGSFGRLTEQLVLSNEKALAGALSGSSVPAASAQPAPVIEVPQASNPAPVQAVEVLLASVEQFVREKRPVSEFLTALTTGTTPEFLAAARQLSVEQITAFGASIGRPDLSERFRQPDVQKYLSEVLTVLKGGDGK